MDCYLWIHLMCMSGSCIVLKISIENWDAQWLTILVATDHDTDQVGVSLGTGTVQLLLIHWRTR